MSKLFICILMTLVSVGCARSSKMELPLCDTKHEGNAFKPGINIMSVKDTMILRIYTPDFLRIDLVCGAMPSPNDSSVLMRCEAAFTGKEIFESGKVRPFEHRFIAGNHVASGKFYKGYKCKGWNYSFYRDNDGTAHFIHKVKTAGTTNWITFYR